MLRLSDSLPRSSNRVGTPRQQLP